MFNRQVIDSEVEKLYAEMLQQQLLSERTEIFTDLRDKVVRAYMKDFAINQTCFSVMFNTYKKLKKTASPRLEEVSLEMGRQVHLLKEKQKIAASEEKARGEILEVKEEKEVVQIKQEKEAKTEVLAVEERIQIALALYPQTSKMKDEEERAYLKELEAILKILKKRFGVLNQETSRKRKIKELDINITTSLTRKKSFEWKVSSLIKMIRAYIIHMTKPAIPSQPLFIQKSESEEIEVAKAEFEKFKVQPGTHSNVLTTITNSRALQEYIDTVFPNAENALKWKVHDKDNLPISKKDMENYLNIFKLAREELSKNIVGWSAQLFTKNPLVIPESLNAALSICDKLGIEKPYHLNINYR